VKVLALVGAGGLARETLALARVLGRWSEVVVLDDDASRWGSTVGGARVLGGVSALPALGPCDVVVCTGRGSTRRTLVERLGLLGIGPERFVSLLHPSVEVPAGCTVGAGSILLARVTLTCDVRIGRHVVVMPQVTLTHDDVVEDYATLCAGVTLGGHVEVGQAAYVGMGASVRERVRIGPEATLGMGAVLLGDLPAGCTWAGVPARAVRSAAQLSRVAP